MDLTPQEAAGRLAAGEADLIDVREQYEWDAGHIAGARHVPVHDLAGAAQDLHHDRPVMFVCRVGARSGMATEAFRRAGFVAYNVAGGVVAWESGGLPFDGVVADH